MALAGGSKWRSSASENNQWRRIMKYQWRRKSIIELAKIINQSKQCGENSGISLAKMA
jgi:hypothetical protein